MEAICREEARPSRDGWYLKKQMIVLTPKKQCPKSLPCAACTYSLRSKWRHNEPRKH